MSARDRFLKFKAEKAVQAQAEAPSVSMLTPVAAPASVRKSLGANYVLTPCRRSTRKARRIGPHSASLSLHAFRRRLHSATTPCSR